MKKLILIIAIPLLVFCEKQHPPTCEIISPIERTEFIRGELVTISVDAYDSDGTVKEVRFFIDGIGITSIKDFPYNYMWETQEVELGIHTIRAIAIDDNNLEGEASIALRIAIYGPSVTTGEITQITANSAVCSGEVTDDGGSVVTEKGFCWSENTTPTVEDNKVTSGSGSGSFNTTISGLEPFTNYNIRAFATNEKGTAYGEQKMFTTTDNSFIDVRDGKEYEFVTIGTQIWMAENLSFLPSINHPAHGDQSNPCYYVHDYYGNNVDEAKSSAFYISDGVLYNWTAATKACPDGWHLPLIEEWEVLVTFLTENGYGYGGSGDDIGKSLASKMGWNETKILGTIGNNQETNNSSGFNAFPNGVRASYNGGIFEPHGADATFWSATPASASSKILYRHLHAEREKLFQYPNYRDYGFAVRCIKD